MKNIGEEFEVVGYRPAYASWKIQEIFNCIW